MTNVLLVEDDTWQAEQFLRTLRAHGYETRHAETAHAAIDAIDATIPGVIILDMFLAGPNAFGLLHELRSHADVSRVPVVLCTSDVSRLQGIDVRAYGIREVLDKTIMHPDDIAASVRRIML